MTTLQTAEEALKECQRLLKAKDDYEWLYWNTDYPQRVDKHIAEALDAVIELNRSKRRLTARECERVRTRGA